MYVCVFLLFLFFLQGGVIFGNLAFNVGEWGGEVEGSRLEA